jgi:MFS family permease
MAGSRKPIFYGWWVALAAALGIGLGSPPILVFSFPVFLKALTQEFHASRSAIALAFSLHNLVSASAAPFAGRIFDRLGVRRMVLPGTVLFAVSMLGNRYVTVSVNVFNIVGALLGKACGPIPYSSIISRWFDRRRGTALAVMMSGLGTAAVLMPSIVQHLITVFSWRAAYERSSSVNTTEAGPFGMAPTFHG